MSICKYVYIISEKHSSRKSTLRPNLPFSRPRLLDNVKNLPDVASVLLRVSWRYEGKGLSCLCAETPHCEDLCLLSLLTSALNAGGWVASRPFHFPPGTNRGSHWIGGRVCPSGMLDVAAERNVVSRFRSPAKKHSYFSLLLLTS
jgi:hypothetical protein